MTSSWIEAPEFDAGPEETEEGVPVKGWYRGRPIYASTGKFKRMGDGLSKSMRIEGEVDEPKTRVAFVVLTTVGPHRLIPTEDKDLEELAEERGGTVSIPGYFLEHDYFGGTVARVDYDLVRGVLDAMETRLAEREKGQGAMVDASEGREVTPGEGVTVGDGERRLAAVPDADFHDEETNPGAPNDLVGATVGGVDASPE